MSMTDRKQWDSYLEFVNVIVSQWDILYILRIANLEGADSDCTPFGEHRIWTWKQFMFIKFVRATWNSAILSMHENNQLNPKYYEMGTNQSQMNARELMMTGFQIHHLPEIIKSNRM